MEQRLSIMTCKRHVYISWSTTIFNLAKSALESKCGQHITETFFDLPSHEQGNQNTHTCTQLFNSIVLSQFFKRLDPKFFLAFYVLYPRFFAYQIFRRLLFEKRLHSSKHYFPRYIKLIFRGALSNVNLR